MLIERRKLLQASAAIIITLMLCQRAYGSIIMQHIDTKFISVYCMFKDRDGMMWAGTSRGLMSYPQLLSTAPTDYKRPHDLSNIITQIRQDNLDDFGCARRPIMHSSMTHTATNSSAMWNTTSRDSA